jgi:hypothetical protein
MPSIILTAEPNDFVTQQLAIAGTDIVEVAALV